MSVIDREIRWHAQESTDVEHCRVRVGSDGVVVAGSITGGPGACSYEFRATTAWEFASLALDLDDRRLEVERGPDGWWVDGVPRPDLAEAHEIDLSVSPVTNTLPIRRLDLDVGESADITTAYVSVPDLEVVADPQRYTRLTADAYLYESRDSDFRREITVDDLGLVVDYPGLFERSGP